MNKGDDDDDDDDNNNNNNINNNNVMVKPLNDMWLFIQPVNFLLQVTLLSKIWALFYNQLLGKYNFNFLYPYQIEKHSSHVTAITSSGIVSKAKPIAFLKFWQNGSILKSPMKWASKVS